jgi:hypothetical protein
VPSKIFYSSTPHIRSIGHNDRGLMKWRNPKGCGYLLGPAQILESSSLRKNSARYGFHRFNTCRHITAAYKVDNIGVRASAVNYSCIPEANRKQNLLRFSNPMSNDEEIERNFAAEAHHGIRSSRLHTPRAVLTIKQAASKYHLKFESASQSCSLGARATSAGHAFSVSEKAVRDV